MFGSGTGVSVLVVMRLQVLANDTLHLQCAKLKVREVSGGRNRAGAGLVSRAQHFPPPPARGALCLLPPPSTHLSLSLSLSLSLKSESFCKKFALVFAQVPVIDVCK